jgi:hypothetical protein
MSKWNKKNFLGGTSLNSGLARQALYHLSHILSSKVGQNFLTFF